MFNRTILMIIVTVTLLFCGKAFAIIVEDFENVSDWYVVIGATAGSDNTITTDAAHAQVGSYAGALTYELSAAFGDNYAHYKKDYTTALDLSASDMVFKFKMMIPVDNRFVQIRLTDAGGKWIEKYLGTGTGQWVQWSLPLAQSSGAWAFSPSGYPNLAQIKQIRIEACGDSYDTYSTGTIYVDDMVATQQNYVLINDFEASTSGWYASKSGAAISASAALTTPAAEGFWCDAFTYGVSTATGNDYCDFYKDGLHLNLSSVDSICMFVKMPNDPQCIIVFQAYDTLAAHKLEYQFAEGTGNWQFVQIPLSLAQAGFNAGDITLLRFRVIGDTSAIASTNTFYADYITGGSPKQNCTLQFDANGDCKIDFKDFAAFAAQWLTPCGYDIAALCQY